MFLIILLLLIRDTLQDNIFAGNGLKTYAQNILNGQTFEMDCTTYDDCYEILCTYMFQPMFSVTLKPYFWNQSCDTLNKNDNRLLAAEIDSYSNSNYLGDNSTNNVSDMSVLLCKLNKNSTINQLQYFVYNCSFF